MKEFTQYNELTDRLEGLMSEIVSLQMDDNTDIFSKYERMVKIKSDLDELLHTHDRILSNDISSYAVVTMLKNLNDINAFNFEMALGIKSMIPSSCTFFNKNTYPLTFKLLEELSEKFKFNFI